MTEKCDQLNCALTPLETIAVSGPLGWMKGTFCRGHAQYILRNFPWESINRRFLPAISIKGLDEPSGAAQAQEGAQT